MLPDESSDQSLKPTAEISNSQLVENVKYLQPIADNDEIRLSEKPELKNADEIKSFRSPFRDLCKSYGLKRFDEMPKNCREDFIVFGYRPNPSSASYCFRSLFLPSNETINVWTHAIPAIFLLCFNVDFLRNEIANLEWSDPLLLPFWFFVFGTNVVLFGSSAAHLFNCLSAGIREVCFCCDYGAIAVYAIGIVSVSNFYICPYACLGFKNEWFNLYFLILLGNVISVGATCYTRYPGVRFRFLLRSVPFAVMCTILFIPCVLKYNDLKIGGHATFNMTSSMSSPLACNLVKTPEAAWEFYQVVGFLSLGVVIYALKMPEKLHPGMFDLVGHSHQIFHVMMALGIYHNNKVLHIAVKEISEMKKIGHQVNADLLHMSWFQGFFLPLLSVVATFALAFYFGSNMHRRLNEEQKEKVQ